MAGAGNGFDNPKVRTSERIGLGFDSLLLHMSDELTDLRTRIIAAIAKADQDWCSDNPLHEDMADAVIRELGLPTTWGTPSFQNGIQ